MGTDRHQIIPIIIGSLQVGCKVAITNGNYKMQTKLIALLTIIGIAFSLSCQSHSSMEMKSLSKQITNNDADMEKRLDAVDKLGNHKNEQALKELENCLVNLEDSDLVVKKLVDKIGKFNTPESRKILKDFLESRRQINIDIQQQAQDYVNQKDSENKPK